MHLSEEGRTVHTLRIDRVTLFETYIATENRGLKINCESKFNELTSLDNVMSQDRLHYISHS